MVMTLALIVFAAVLLAGSAGCSPHPARIMALRAAMIRGFVIGWFTVVS
jgi:hypothetical protein